MPNINDFKAKLRGGGARANQFRVTMPFPGFAAVGGETETMSFLTKRQDEMRAEMRKEIRGIKSK